MNYNLLASVGVITRASREVSAGSCNAAVLTFRLTLRNDAESCARVSVEPARGHSTLDFRSARASADVRIWLTREAGEPACNRHPNRHPNRLGFPAGHHRFG